MDINEFFDVKDDLSDEERSKILKERLGLSSEELEELPVSDKQIIANKLFANLDEKRLELQDQIIQSLVELAVSGHSELKPVIEPLIKALMEKYAYTCSQYGFINGQYSVLRQVWDKQNENK